MPGTAAVDPANSDGRTQQSSMLVIVPIRRGHVESLEKLLAAIAGAGAQLEVNPIVPFRQLTTVHFARILIHPAVDDAGIPAKVLFSTDFDGPIADHIDELLRVAGTGLDRIFEHCDGWPGHQQRDRAHTFFSQNRLRSNTFYTGTMNRSVGQILR